MARLGGGTTTDTTSTSNELYYAGEAFKLGYDVGEGEGTRRVGTSFIGYTISAKAVAVEVTNGEFSTALPYGECEIADEPDSFTTRISCSNLGGAWTQNSPVDLIPIPADDPNTRDGVCEVPTTHKTEFECVTHGKCVNKNNTSLITDNVTLADCATSTGETQETLTNRTGGWTPNIWTENTQKAEGKFSIYIPSTILSDVGFSEAPQPGEPLFIAYSIDYTEGGSSGDEETRVIETDIIGFRWTPMFDINIAV